MKEGEDLLRDLKIAVAISDLTGFVRRKEKEEKEATGSIALSGKDPVETTLPTIISSQNHEMSGETDVESKEIENLQQKMEPNFADLQKVRINDIEKMNNPWLSKNKQHHQQNEVPEVPPEDYVVKTIAPSGCSIRAFKNASFYSTADFIHEYVEYKTCSNGAAGG